QRGDSLPRRRARRCRACSAGRSVVAEPGSGSRKAEAEPGSDSLKPAAGRDRACPAPELASCRQRPAAEAPERAGARASTVYLASASRRMRTILSGALTAPLFAELPFLILRTTSMPETTSPNRVYWPVREPQ